QHMTGYTQTLYALPPRGRRMLDVTLPARFLLPSLGAVVFAVTLCQVLFLSQGAQALFRDSDTGWHVRNGEAILQNFALPRVDHFSYTREGQRWFYALPVVACVWANVHGSFLLGPAMLFTYVIGEWFTNFAVNVSTNELGTPSRIPLLDKGGVAAPSIKMFRRHLIWRGRGGSFK